MISKKIWLPVITVATVGAAAILSLSVAHAQTNASPWSGLAQMIAQKFGLDQTQVQSVVDQYHNQEKQTMMQNMQQREASRLDKLVSDGKITSAQKQAIIDELAALKNKYNPQNLASLTQEQRQAQFKAEQDEITSWAKAQGIDPTYLRPTGYMKGGRGHMNDWPKTTPTPTPSG